MNACGAWCGWCGHCTDDDARGAGPHGHARFCVDCDGAHRHDPDCPRVLRQTAERAWTKAHQQKEPPR